MSSDQAPLSAPRPVHHEGRAVVWGARALAYLIYTYVVVTEVVLVLGFFLLLLGANPDTPFVEWAYRSLDRAMEPFRGIFTSIELGNGANQVEAVLDTSVLFAMVIYGLLAWLIHSGIVWLTRKLERSDWQDRTI
ncbi:hypothetical protein [Nocardioides bizhenqiangii]|uniref:YggT family protein n=1 Tax=Nocardioides bizhenqiangii TaxID=3095076 RepID=A0ABZ0ZWB6_9ACTN|nr:MULTISPECIES: hypothetical protein [unclassified Nocardioides]MDZ5623032.1 hypothetical protein [Nocardioides sp. HM23]WQQ28011.1 hypothetical protein SHK19_07205 [Nocardioides sp. HM61]